MDTHDLAPPTPRRFYVHDDISDSVRESYGPDSPAFLLTQELLELIRRRRERVAVLTLEDQIEGLIAKRAHTPYGVTIGIGRAGERVAERLHERTGWFPYMRRVDVAREETGTASYLLISTTGETVSKQLAGLEPFSSVAVVDDTVFSGLTMRTVLLELPEGVLARSHVFCLRAVTRSLPEIRALCPVAVGFEAGGRILEDVSFINASGLVLRVAIRRAGKTPMAFFEREAWMRAWFPEDYLQVISLCRRLNSTLEPEKVLT